MNIGRSVNLPNIIKYQIPHLRSTPYTIHTQIALLLPCCILHHMMFWRIQHRLYTYRPFLTVPRYLPYIKADMSLNSLHRIQKVSSDWEIYQVILRPRSQFSIYLPLISHLLEEIEPATTFYICFCYPSFSLTILWPSSFGVARPSLSRLLQSKRFEGEVRRSSSPLDMIGVVSRTSKERMQNQYIEAYHLESISFLFLLPIHDVEWLRSSFMP